MINFNSADSFLEKKNDPNKRVHVEKSFFQSSDPDFRYSSDQLVQPQITVQNFIPVFQISALPQVQFNQFSAMSSDQTVSSVILFSINQFFNSEFIFSQSKTEPNFFFATEIKTKKKNPKKLRKKMKIQSIVEMMNDNTELYDRPFSIRNVLKRNKVDISFMNWIA